MLDFYHLLSQPGGPHSPGVVGFEMEFLLRGKKSSENTSYFDFMISFLVAKAYEHSHFVSK